MPINSVDIPDQPLHVAAVQMISTDDWQENLRKIKLMLDSMAQLPAPRLVQLPENALCFGASAQRALAMQPEACLPQLAGLAEYYRCYLQVGSFPMALRGDGAATDGRLRSASLVFGPDGTLLSRYDKIHLFDVDVADAQGGYRESDTFEPGEQIQLCQIEQWCIGLGICYDLRFPELFLNLRAAGCHVLTVPSAFTAVTGEAHWEALLRARAIETQSYVIAANQGGRHSETRETWGHSMVIDPWGKVIAACGKGEGVISAVLEPELLAKVRREMPLQQHRRLSFRIPE
ncbi:MAG: carbon-nitrogen hydrolase family protein [Oleiphilaceae bacterium]|nr:carbon-nitrogen hydrolase family protein [Oleiphilaceae bacterium]